MGAAGPQMILFDNISLASTYFSYLSDWFPEWLLNLHSTVVDPAVNKHAAVEGTYDFPCAILL